MFVCLIVAVSASSALAQTWTRAVSASTTASSAAITWITALPSDSQVEYGTTTVYGASAHPAVPAHSPTLTGLTSRTTDHFRGAVG
jgi:hypothetical protein